MSRESDTDYRAELTGLPTRDVPDYLTGRSGLPGPRANLTLMAAFAEWANASLIEAMATREDDYLRCCGVVGIGRLAAGTTDPGERDDIIARLHGYASSGAWRVREAVAMALQRLGDERPAVLRGTATDWAADPDPLVVRAALAGICEPRLLKDPDTARTALAVCEAATVGLLRLPATDRRSAPARTLRQGLGYCWSVAVAGLPAEGLRRFRALQERATTSGDKDLAWIVRSNLGKARLRRLLEA